MAFMRLLQRQSNGDIVFREPTTTNEAPAYAILSHAWGKEEVNFQDMDTGADRSKTLSKVGWMKIQFCAQQAAADGLQYFWVDTCCIDKRNAVELSAAINSMFRWYQDAARCYVFMSDVSKPTPGNGNDSIWIDQFRASRWFQRGWTLQELIAPNIVKFFSHEGNTLGYKSTLEQELHTITQIPIRALRRSDLSEFGLQERLKWAARRTTTLEEDKVYSLLGIFNVFISPIYGEGRTSALSRLQEAINSRHNQPPLEPAPAAWGVSARSRRPEEDKQRIDDVEMSLGHKEDGGHSLSTTQSSVHGQYPSLPSAKPGPDLPTNEFRNVLDKLSRGQQMEIAIIINKNCQRAAYDFFRENDLWRTRFDRRDAPDDRKLFQLADGRFPERPDDLSLRVWIRKIQHASSEPHVDTTDFISSGMMQDISSDGPFNFRKALNITRMTDAQGKLNPVEFESSLCYAIAWCWHLFASKCEARLRLLWDELHPTTIDENWSPNLEHVRVDHVRVSD